MIDYIKNQCAQYQTKLCEKAFPIHKSYIKKKYIDYEPHMY